METYVPVLVALIGGIVTIWAAKIQSDRKNRRR